jgi:hypothetical protein
LSCLTHANAVSDYILRDNEDFETKSNAETTGLAPASGPMRKTASAITLRGAENDDVFGPDNTTTTTPDLSNTDTTNTALGKEPTTISERIAAGCLSLVPPSMLPTYAPRPDRGTEVTVHNAQGIWPPEAIVFVAK